MSQLPASTRPPYQGPVTVRERPSDAQLLDFLDLLSFLMDRCFTVPGTEVRFGLNSLMLLIPVLGDALAGMISFMILSIGLSHYRVPRIVATRMVLNSLVDTTISSIPILGNLFDVYFKADTRNIRLLKEYIGQGDETPSTWRHWLFVVGLLAGLVLLLALLLTGLIALIVVIVQALHNLPAR